MATDPIDVLEAAPLAIDGRGIYFYFDSKKKAAVLNDVNISVTRGIIYSLLGPSGCGKTTLLKCIVGQHKMQEGCLRVYGKTPGSKRFFIPGRGVGYMPQDIALYPEMTTKETLIYFGYLYLMSPKEVKARTSFLVELLAIPDKNKLIKFLSGGQQRRVSLAAALIHRPPLLILDEPTVGVDPLLRQTIWDHLAALAKDEGLTIILTTHYIEEARQADVVGLMRNGHLLVERNPEDLIKQYKVSTLENVFLKLCQSDSNGDKNYKTYSGAVDTEESFSRNTSSLLMSKGENEAHPNKELLGKNEQVFILSPVKVNSEVSKGITKGTFDGKIEAQDNTTSLLSPGVVKDIDFITTSHAFRDSWKRILCLTNKNFLRFKRNFLLAMTLPTLWFKVCSDVLKAKDNTLKEARSVITFVCEREQDSKQPLPNLVVIQVLLPAFEMAIFCVCIGSDLLDLPLAVTNVEENPGGFGKEFLLYINNKTIQQKEYSNFSEALESVKKGENCAAVYIGPEFSNCLIERFMLGAEVDNDTAECSEIQLYLDMSNQQIGVTIYSNLLKSFQTFASDMLVKYDQNPVAANIPLVVKDNVYGSAATTVTEFMAPGMILSVTYITCVGLTALAIIMEKKQGLLDRTFVAGSSSTEVLISLFIIMLATLAAQVIFVLACTFLIFEIPCHGSLLWVGIGVLLTGIGGMAYGICISAMCDDENFAMIFAMGTFYPNLLLSGILWPVEAMPRYLRYISYCLPLTLISHSVRSIISRGWDITQYYTWDGYLISIFWIILFVGLSLLLFKIRK